MRAANNGPDPVAVANSMRQYIKNTLIIGPLQQLVKEGICGGSPSGAVKEGRVGGGRVAYPSHSVFLSPKRNEGAPFFARSLREGWVADRVAPWAFAFHAAGAENEILPHPSFTRTGPGSSRK